MALPANRTTLGAGVLKYLDVSTAHITLQDDRLLKRSCSDPAFAGPLAYEYEEGYWVWVPDKPTLKAPKKGYKTQGFSKAFVQLLEGADREGCSWIRLDADGFVYSCLPQFDWNEGEGEGKSKDKDFESSKAPKDELLEALKDPEKFVGGMEELPLVYVGITACGQRYAQQTPWRVVAWANGKGYDRLYYMGKDLQGQEVWSPGGPADEMPEFVERHLCAAARIQTKSRKK